MTDVVDDLECAEEYAGSAVHVLSELVDAVASLALTWSRGEAVGPDEWEAHLGTMATAVATVSTWDLYCRPSCTWLDTGECESGGEENGCGCRCEHVKRCADCREQIDEPVLAAGEPERCESCAEVEEAPLATS